jgi:alpha-D-ribose 1-methylphosphonate 5-triphosphate synthase subunit PhnG
VFSLWDPRVWAAIVVALVISHGAVGYKAYRMGQDNIIAETSKIIDAEVRTRDAALAATADAISKIEVKYVTVRQKAETVVREVPVYTDCTHSDDGMRLVNEALRQPTRDGKLPASNGTDRQ